MLKRSPTGSQTALLAAMTAIVLFSGGNLLVRGAPFVGTQLVVYRALFGGVLYNSVLAKNGRRVTVDTLRTSLPGALGWAGQAVLFYSALQMTSVASATVIAALQPLFTIPVTRHMYGEKYTLVHFVLIAGAIGGTVLVVGASVDGGGWSIWGDLLALAGTFCGVLYFVGTKRARATLKSLEYQSSLLVIAVVVLFPIGVLRGGFFEIGDPSNLLWPFALALVPGTGHLLMSWAQGTLSVATTSMLILGVVPLTTVGALVTFSDAISLAQGVGIVIVLICLGVFVRISVDEPHEGN